MIVTSLIRTFSGCHIDFLQTTNACTIINAKSQMALPSMISSLGIATVPIYSCKDVVGKQQRTIDVLYAMIKQEINHSCRDYLNDGEDCIRNKKLNSNDHVSGSGQKLTAEDREQIVDWCYGAVDVLQLARSNHEHSRSIHEQSKPTSRLSIHSSSIQSSKNHV